METENNTNPLSKIVAVPPIVKKTEPLENTDPEIPGEISVDIQGRLLKTYFELESKIGSLIETYNNWVVNILPVQLADYKFEIPEGEVTILNTQIYKPRYSVDNNFEPLYPRMARDNGYTYSFDLYGYLVLNAGTDKQQIWPNPIFIAKIPAMLGSIACWLEGKTHKELNELGECGWDPLGYFIIKGTEKVVLIQERLRPNRILLFNSTSRGDVVCKMSCRSRTRYSNVTLAVQKDGSIGIHLPFMGRTPFSDPNATEKDDEPTVNKKIGNTVPVFIIFRMLGIENPQHIMQYITLFSKKKYNNKIFVILQNTFASTADIGDPIEYISKYFKNVKDLPYNIRKNSILNDLRNELFPQIPPENLTQKIYMLSIMIVRLAEYMIGVRKLDDRDNWAIKQLLTAGNSLEELFTGIWRDVRLKIQDKNPSNLRSLADIILNRSSSITDNFVYSFTANNWGAKGSTMKQNITEQLDRKSTISVYAHLTRISNSGSKNSSIKVRLVDMSQLGYICPAETPEGEKCGLVKNTAITLYISIDRGENRVVEAVGKYMAKAPTEQYTTPLMLNGKFIGWCEGKIIQNYAIQLRRKNYIHKDTAIIYDPDDDYLYIFTDGSRPTRPLLIIDPNTGELVIKMKNLWNADMETLLKEGCVEYIDAAEQQYIYLAQKMDNVDLRKSEIQIAQRNYQEAIEKVVELERIRDDPVLQFQWMGTKGIEESIIDAKRQVDDTALLLKEVPYYTHSEIDPTAILSLSASLIPLANHNQAPRNTYQCKMGSQSMGIYHSQNATRFDTTAKCLAFPTRPLFETQMNQVLGLNELPAGSMVIVAITTYTGYNQEDAIIMNRSAIDRGLFRQVLYKSYKDVTERKSSELTERFERPEAKQTGKENDRDIYHAIDDNGVPILGSFVREKDCIIGKVRYNTETGTKENASTFIGVGMEGVVDRILVSTNSDGNKVVKVKIRQVRSPIIGDKFASRYAQKATLGMILNQEDMPYTMQGMVPDIIINPHTIPSRMTIAKLIEIISSKVGVFQGERINATSYRKFDLETFKRNLTQYGYSSRGKEKLISGFTGKLMEADIYMGPCYYQALQHNVADKIQMRAEEGPITKLARQPVGGRASRGGQRFGEMERDAIISHGASAFLQERLCTVSDAYKNTYCSKCNKVAMINLEENKFVCNTCGPKAEFGLCTIPYAYKLLSNMLAGAGFNLTLDMARVQNPQMEGPRIENQVLPENQEINPIMEQEVKQNMEQNMEQNIEQDRNNTKKGFTPLPPLPK
jgi:DNA-directed RNA polymerase II subunit RPB2